MPAVAVYLFTGALSQTRKSVSEALGIQVGSGAVLSYCKVRSSGPLDGGLNLGPDREAEPSQQDSGGWTDTHNAS